MSYVLCFKVCILVVEATSTSTKINTNYLGFVVDAGGLAAAAAVVHFLPAVRLFAATGGVTANSPALPSGERLPAAEPSRDKDIIGGVKLRDLISGGVKHRD